MNPFILLFIMRIDDIYWRPHLFPELGGARSERREALCRLLKRFAYRMDILTCEVGEPEANGRLATIPMRFHLPWLGLSRWRADRAIQHARCSGFLKSSQRRKGTKDGPRGVAARRILTATLFKRLRLETELAVAQQQARARGRAPALATGTRVPEGASQPDVRSALRAFARDASRRLGGRFKVRREEVPTFVMRVQPAALSCRLHQEIVKRSDDFETAKMLRELAQSLHAHHPELSDDEIVSRLDRVRGERMLD